MSETGLNSRGFNTPLSVAFRAEMLRDMTTQQCARDMKTAEFRGFHSAQTRQWCHCGAKWRRAGCAARQRDTVPCRHAAPPRGAVWRWRGCRCGVRARVRTPAQSPPFPNHAKAPLSLENIPFSVQKLSISRERFSLEGLTPSPTTPGGLWGNPPHLRSSCGARTTYGSYGTYSTPDKQKARATPRSCPGERSAAL